MWGGGLDPETGGILCTQRMLRVTGSPFVMGELVIRPSDM